LWGGRRRAGRPRAPAGDLAAEAAQLKQQGGKDLVIYGHGLLAQTLLAQGLLDEPQAPESIHSL
jgi:dihydrofolate reductase